MQSTIFKQEGYPHSPKINSLVKAYLESGEKEINGVRSVSDIRPLGNFGLSPEWHRIAQTCVNSIGSKRKVNLSNNNLMPGDIEFMNIKPDYKPLIDGSLAPLLQCLNLPNTKDLGLEEFNLDSSILYCLGSKFHNDAHGWTNDLFLNWYVAGPVCDLIFPQLGEAGRMTLRPGDAFIFDPAMTHGLVNVGADIFDEDDYFSESDDERSLDPDRLNFSKSNYSLFVSHVLPLTPALDAHFGIDRFSADVFSSRKDWLNILDDENKINANTGKLTARKKPFDAIRISSDCFESDDSYSARLVSKCLLSETFA